MGIAQIVGFAVCWAFVATVLLWAVLTERHRGPSPDPQAEATTAESPWVVVETVDGDGPAATAEAQFLLVAWLAARGIELSDLSPSDWRREVVTAGDGQSRTRVSVRATALNRSSRQLKRHR